LVVALSDPKVPGALLGGIEQLNFAEQTAGLKKPIQGLEAGDTATMDGVETTEYVVTVDMAALYAQVDGPSTRIDVDNSGF